MGFYLLGCICLGLTTGFLVGASQSPVVQYALPLLFALIGGSAGVFAFKNPASKTSEDKLKIAGLTAASLSLPFLLMVIYGALYRTGDSLESLIPHWSRPQPEPTLLTADVLNAIPTSDALHILIADRNLAAMRVNREDRNLLLRHAIEARTLKLAEFERLGMSVMANARALRSRLLKAGEINPALQEDANFLISQIELENLDNLGQSNIPLVSRLGIARTALANLQEQKSESFAQFLVSDPETAQLFGKITGDLYQLPADEILSEDLRTSLEKAAQAGSAKEAAFAALPISGGGRGIASTDAPDY